MRLLSITVMGAALVTAGLVTPAAGAAKAQARVEVSPGVARPGQRVGLTVPGCSVGTQRHWAESKVFTGPVTLGGKADAGLGTATVRHGAAAGTYKIVAHCGARTLTGRIKVSSRGSWPAVLSGSLDPRAPR
ncbi:hypothetical protein [Actinomadura macrotermitis]|uniref:Ig-like domain-containing protein n=1 Tax=Actinomadura macrotermitis TaxID=2585200 RepID=A0A7K0BYX7_9ACTN|nr:hypothetical protein [Actinomadura macrotermitis]MQY06062.1 hypothetical protein [Actinomadura macrotermitis]